MENLSIIVPIYNKEDCLEDSLNSLLNGVSQETELLLIDDNSTDKSFSIAKEFAKKDARIRLLKNKVNRGVGATRNRGIQEAKGEYIGFFDADDKVDYRFYDKLCQSAFSTEIKPDIVVGGFQCIDVNNLQIIFPSMPILVDGFDFSLQRRKFVSSETCSCCNKIYHSPFLKEKYFLDYMKEDLYFHYWTMWSAQNVLENRKTDYYYRPKDNGRNLSYYNLPNGNFYDLIEGYEWLRQKIGNEEFLSSFHKAQQQAFSSYIQSIDSWNLSFDSELDLIGALVDYCIRVHHMNLESLDIISEKYYDLYKEKYPKTSLEHLKEKLNRLSYNYPNRRRK